MFLPLVKSQLNMRSKMEEVEEIIQIKDEEQERTNEDNGEGQEEKPLIKTGVSEPRGDLYNCTYTICVLHVHVCHCIITCTCMLALNCYMYVHVQWSHASELWSPRYYSQKLRHAFIQ